MVMKDYKRLVNLKLAGLFLILAPLLQGCAYSGKFNCPDSQGANCAMLNRVDQMVDSGEIEKYYRGKGSTGSKGCLFGKCNSGDGVGSSDDRPPLASSEVIKAKISNEDEERGIIEGDYLYVK